MKPDDIGLGAVNWEHGMLLAPEHFLRQERYFDSALLWLLRYATSAYGLIGGGPRLPESERGAERHDPIVDVVEDDDTISFSVTQCRGLTPGGCIIDIDPEHPLRQRLPKKGLEGASELLIYVTCEPHNKEAIDGPTDEHNPQMKTERRLNYEISLRVPADRVQYAVGVGRLRRRPYGVGYEKDPDYIPACTSMVGCSQLASSWRRIVEDVTRLAARYTDLSRSMQEYLRLFKERGIETELDAETSLFASRMVVALQDCRWEILDPTQSPQRFFGRVHRFLHSAAAYLNLSPPTYQYLQELRDFGVTEFIPLLEQQKRMLEISPQSRLNDDLAIDVRHALRDLNDVARLEQALEGKYIDFRVNPSLEAMNFVFDRGGRVLYRLAAKPARVQGSADEQMFTFVQLELKGRDRYRLILTSVPTASFERGAKITAEIRINEGSGFKRPPVIISSEATFQGQRNFEFDFDAPEDVPTITNIRVSVAAREPVRSALLYVRHRFYVTRSEEPGGRALQPESAPLQAMPASSGFSRVDPMPGGQFQSSPRDLPTREDRPDDTRGGIPPRRRRLE